MKYQHNKNKKLAFIMQAFLNYKKVFTIILLTFTCCLSCKSVRFTSTESNKISDLHLPKNITFSLSEIKTEWNINGESSDIFLYGFRVSRKKIFEKLKQKHPSFFSKNKNSIPIIIKNNIEFKAVGNTL